MKVETTNLTELPLCLAVVGIRTREIMVQVRDRNLPIDDIAFELFAMHCSIGRGIRQKKIPQEK